MSEVTDGIRTSYPGATCDTGDSRTFQRQRERLEDSVNRVSKDSQESSPVPENVDKGHRSCDNEVERCVDRGNG